MRTIQIQPFSALLGAAALGLVLGLSSLVQGTPGLLAVKTLTPEQAEILSHLSIVQLDDGFGGKTKTIRFSDVNVQIVNGLEATNGNPLAPNNNLLVASNGRGNLIIGYNEPRAGVFSVNDRRGSHNLVVGQEQNYTSFGGIVAGDQNSILAPYATVTGGGGNSASGVRSSVSGGLQRGVPGADDWAAGTLFEDL